jgi:hypothetical protein
VVMEWSMGKINEVMMMMKMKMKMMSFVTVLVIVCRLKHLKETTS